MPVLAEVGGRRNIDIREWINAAVPAALRVSQCPSCRRVSRRQCLVRRQPLALGPAVDANG